MKRIDILLILVLLPLIVESYLYKYYCDCNEIIQLTINNNKENYPDYITKTVNGVKFKMIKVEGGSFNMGSNDGISDEQPIRQVSIPTFYMAETEVTQELWEVVMGDNPSWFKGSYDYPAESVSWKDIQKFIIKLNQLTGKSYRLPSEAEWEYAAKGGNKSKGYKYSGSNNIEDVAWYNKNSNRKTHLVATKKPNELGLYDMSGNVWEWCQDKWHSNYIKAPTDGSAWIFDTPSNYRVLRGGSFYYEAKYCNTNYRYLYSERSNNINIGFRLVIDI